MLVVNWTLVWVLGLPALTATLFFWLIARRRLLEQERQVALRPAPIRRQVARK